uniref:Transmembrane protein n=1 Tax=Caenorhabditis tropicalis TaxID=1561998 RepID=A0A1I7T711_9PELO
MKQPLLLAILLLALQVAFAEDNATEISSTTAPSIDPPTLPDQVSSSQGQIISHDVNGELIPPAMKAISKASAAEPSLGLHGITEQQLNLRYYNFICSSHFHLDCKLTETLQICMKDRYVAVLGLPLAFDSGSQDLTYLTKWMRQCDQNDQDQNQEAMRLIRKRIHFQNENNWEGVFKSAGCVSLAIGLLFVVLNYFWI